MKTKILITFIFILSVLLTKADDRENLFDIKNYTIQLNLTNIASKTLLGTTSIHLQSRSNNLASVRLDLAKLTVSSVLANADSLLFSQNDSELFINFKRPLNQNDSIQLDIAYAGQPTKDPSWGGFYFSGNYAFNLGVGFNVKPHNFGRCWFPCVDNFTDRATYDFHINTDSGYKAICNGSKQTETYNNDGSITWHWTLKDEIPSYLASVAVSNYVFLQYNFQGKSKSFPVIIACQAQDTSKLKASFLNLNLALHCFEDKFDPYPFERAGYVAVPFEGGAMEHATSIAYPIFAIDGTTNYETLFAHELSHMWWGNHVTCRTAEDMWLNEGWASYCEAQFLECLYGTDAYKKEIKSNWNTVLRFAAAKDGGLFALSNAPHNATYGTTVYKKGALIVHSLRSFMGDSAFFAACKSYQKKFAFKDASSTDLKNEFQRFTSSDLSAFFDMYVSNPSLYNVRVLKSELNNGVISVQLTQDLKNTQRGFNNIPLSITFFDNNIRIVRDFIFNNEGIYTFTIGKINFDKDFYTIIDSDDKYFKARSMQNQTIKSTGLKNFADAFCGINTQSISDSVNINIEHNWIGGKWWEVAPAGIRISNQRHWIINGFLPSSFKAQGFFNYDGSTPENPSNSGWLDNEFIDRNEDSLVMLYRANGTEMWQLLTDCSINIGGSKTDKVGRITVNNLKVGEYAIGKKDVTSITQNVLPENSDFIQMYPNPAKNLINIQIKKQYKNIDLLIMDITGKTIRRIILKSNENEIDISNLIKGQYFFVFNMDGYSKSKSVMVN
jgi:aminopeptidase N